MVAKRSTRKPPYYVPSMKDVAKTRGKNSYKVISTFSGYGGSCLGFEMAGFDPDLRRSTASVDG